MYIPLTACKQYCLAVPKLRDNTWQHHLHAKRYGFSLAVVYAVWISVIIITYPLCKWYDRYKTAHPDKWWLSYI